MELQPRDLAILEAVGEYGTADTAMLRELHFPNDKTGRSCQNRLKRLADEGLLKRVRLIAADGGQQSGSLPTLWFLTEAGAELVCDETGVSPRRLTRSDPKPHTLRHRMDIVRARLAIDKATKLAKIPSPQWILEQDTTGREKAAKGRFPTANRILSNSYWLEEHQRSISFRPDAACHLQIPRPSGKGCKSLLGYLEVDRGTEGHLQWERKLWGIDAFVNDAKAWRGHWPHVSDPAIVVFVLCLSTKNEDSSVRLANLVETAKGCRAYRRLRFTTHPLDPATVLTDDVWVGYYKDNQLQKFRIIAKST